MRTQRSMSRDAGRIGSSSRTPGGWSQTATVAGALVAQPVGLAIELAALPVGLERSMADARRWLAMAGRILGVEGV
jgi:hypothetical protein